MTSCTVKDDLTAMSLICRQPQSVKLAKQAHCCQLAALAVQYVALRASEGAPQPNKACSCCVAGALDARAGAIVRSGCSCALTPKSLKDGTSLSSTAVVSQHQKVH